MEVKHGPSYNVEITSYPIANNPFCRTNSSNSRAWAGIYSSIKPDGHWDQAYVYHTQNGLDWFLSAVRPGGCESSHAIIPFDNGNGVHIGTEQCSARVHDIQDENPDDWTRIISEGQNDNGLVYVLGGGNTNSFGQLIGISGNKIPGCLWWYNNGWEKAPYPKVQNPNNGDGRLIWSVSEYKGWLLLGTSWSDGSAFREPNAGEILAYKPGMSNYVLKGANLGGFVKGFLVMNNVLYASYGNKLIWTDDDNLDNLHVIDAPGVACYNMIQIDERYFAGIWYTGRRFAESFNTNIKIVFAQFDTKTKQFEIKYDFGVDSDKYGDAYSVAGGITKLNDKLIGYINQDQKAYGVKITIG